VSDTIAAVILGAGGYVGGELLRLLASHPQLKLAAAVSGSRGGEPIAATFTHLAQAYAGVEFVAPDAWQETLEAGGKLAIFSAAPHGASAAMIASALETAAQKNCEVHVVDSSADFRYSEQSTYESIYKTEHGAPALLDAFTCAVPEHAGEIDVAHVGHPGCFATASLLAAVPLAASGLSDGSFFVNGITGSTGSGQKPQPGTHHPVRHSNLYAYKPLAHRHAPEIAGLASAASGSFINVHFVPHSGPFTRGIHITLMAKATQDVSRSQLLSLYEAAYADAPFVRVVSGTPRVKDVVASNYCDIGITCDGDAIVVMSVIDNLVKGAAGGAIQWMNRLWDLDETAGLTTAAPGWT
jgi:N-acetyl-gamma-glutamyl-phosphate reductase